MALLEVTRMKVAVLVAGGKGAWLLGATWMKTTTLLTADRDKNGDDAQQRQTMEEMKC
jgi:hypothetical protein